MSYELVKALHIISVITWIGGMLLSSVTIWAIGSTSGDLTTETRSLAQSVKQWDRFVTSPAILLTWTFGITMAVQAGWFSSPWLMIKMVIVFVLSGVHGTLTGTLRRLGGGARPASNSGLNRAAPAILIATAVVVMLVVLKPF